MKLLGFLELLPLDREARLGYEERTKSSLLLLLVVAVVVVDPDKTPVSESHSKTVCLCASVHEARSERLPRNRPPCAHNKSPTTNRNHSDSATLSHNHQLVDTEYFFRPVGTIARTPTDFAWPLCLKQRLLVSPEGHCVLNPGLYYYEPGIKESMAMVVMNRQKRDLYSMSGGGVITRLGKTPVCVCGAVVVQCTGAVVTRSALWIERRVPLDTMGDARLRLVRRSIGRYTHEPSQGARPLLPHRHTVKPLSRILLWGEKVLDRLAYGFRSSTRFELRFATARSFGWSHEADAYNRESALCRLGCRMSCCSVLSWSRCHSASGAARC